MTTLDVLLIAVPSPSPIMYYSNKFFGMPPLGLGYLATVLKKSNYIVDIFDMCIAHNTIELLLDVLSRKRAKVIGLSCTSESYSVALQLAKITKSIAKDCFVVMGGPHVSFSYESTLTKDEVDYIVINEGEISFKNLCDYLLDGKGNLEDIKGIAYTKGGKVVKNEEQPFITDLDALPFPDRSLFGDLSMYEVPATIVTSRGCPGACIFCSAGALSGRSYRMRSAVNIVDEYEYLRELGFKHVRIVDDAMTISKRRMYQLAEELNTRKLDMTWQCESRVDGITKEFLKKMKEAGLVEVQFGVESGSQRVLDSINKQISLEQIINAFKWCYEVGIRATTNIIIGLPSDDENSICDTLRLAERIIEYGGFVTSSVCTPFPGTPLLNDRVKYGINIIEHDLDLYTLQNPTFETKFMSMMDIRNAIYTVRKKLIPKVLEQSFR